MICELSIPHGQNIRTDLHCLRYLIRCPNCKTILYKSPYSSDICVNCHTPIKTRVRHMPGFIPARLRYYNSNYNCFGDDKVV